MKFWDDEKSITLTRCVVVAALIGSIAMTLGGPWVTAWFIAVAGLRHSTGLTATLLVLGYACAALAIGMLVSLYKFLRRIEKGEVFVPENVAALRTSAGAVPGRRCSAWQRFSSATGPLRCWPRPLDLWRCWCGC